MQHHATATLPDRATVDRAVDDLVSASIPHEQMRLVLRRASGEERVPVGPWRPVGPFVAVAAPVSAVAAVVAVWHPEASWSTLVLDAAIAAVLGSLVAAYGALYFWQVRPSWPSSPEADDEVQILTVRGSEAQVRQAASLLDGLASQLETGRDGELRLVDGA